MRIPIFIILFSSVSLCAQLPKLIPYKDHGKWGYADSNGKVIIKPRWNQVSLFYSNNYAWVERDSVFRFWRGVRALDGHERFRFFIDSLGREWLGFNCSYMMDYGEPVSRYYNIQIQESVYRVHDIHGHHICDDCIRREALYLPKRYVFCTKRGCGLKDLKGKVVVKPRYQFVDIFMDDRLNYGDSFYTVFKVSHIDSPSARILNPDFPLWVAESRKHDYLVFDSIGSTLLKIENYGYQPLRIERSQVVERPDTSKPLTPIYHVVFPDSSLLFVVWGRERISCKTYYQRLNLYSPDHFMLSKEIWFEDIYGRRYISPDSAPGRK